MTGRAALCLAILSLSVAGAAGALVSTAGDLVRWQLALTGGGAVSPASYEAMITSTVATGQGQLRYGFGLSVAEVDGRRSISHGGGIPGFNSVPTTLPDERLHVAVISNSSGLASEIIASNIVAALTSAEAPPLPEQRTGALPGSEAAVRRMLGELARGEPDYDLLSPQLAQTTRAQLPAMQPMVAALGAIRSIRFVAVGPQGQDIYAVELENGALTFQIILDADGRTVGTGMSPAAPPSP